MKVETIERNIQRSDSFQERSMGLAVGSESFVFNVLRKDLYSNPIGSLIREYAVNAQDEHRKHGKADQPILIQVPNRFSPELHIRDFAGGLTEEQVFNFFGNYGASDKRDSNVAVGFFGLGCKSAFAYTDSYVVKSFKDGRAYTFNIYIDETEIGRVAKIADENTDEPNGVLIIVPVKTNDTDEFQREVISTVTHFKVKPILQGLSFEPTFNEKKATISGDGWEYFGQGKAKVIMGEIAYPIDYYSMGADIAQWERQLLSSDLHIFCEIGEVQVTASREALQMSPKTVSAIRAKLVLIKDAMKVETQKAFDNAKNLIEAKAIYQSIMLSRSGYGDIIRISGDKIIWKNQELTDSYIRFGDYASHKVSVYTKDYRGKIRLQVSSYLKCEANSTIYFDDTNKVKANYKRRAITLLNTMPDYRNASVTILHTSDVDALEKILGVSVKELKSYNEVVPTMPISTRGAGNGIDLSKRAKHTSKVFVLNTDKVMKIYKGVASEFWDIKEIEVKGGIYIPIERFHPKLPNINSIRLLSSTLSDLKTIGINVDVPIYGVKANGEVKGLIRFDEWITKKLTNNKVLRRKASLVKAFHNSNELIDVSYLSLDLLSDGVVKEYVKLYKEIYKIRQEVDSRTLLRMYSGIDVSKDTELLELSQKIEKKYPLLKYISSYNYKNPEVLAYINGK